MRKHQLLHQHFNRDKSPPLQRQATRTAIAPFARPQTVSVSTNAPIQVGATIGRTVPAGEISREKLFKYVTDGFTVKNGTEMCFQEQFNRNIFLEYLMESRIGSGSINGEAYKVCSPFVCTAQSCECTAHTVHVAVKIVPIGYEAWKLKQQAQASPHSQALIVNDKYPDEKGMERYAVWAELTAMTLVNALVQQSVCPNLPLLFHWFLCSSCNFKNEELLGNRYDFPNNRYIDTVRRAQEGRVALKDPSLITPCAIIMNELANGGDLQMWCANRNLRQGAAQSMMFQIVAGLYAIRKYYGMHHNDMHAGNVLVHILPASHSSGVFKYRIDGRDYYVPHYGFLFVLWDFGYTTIIPNDNDYDDKSGPSLHAMTLDSFENVPNDDCEDMERISDILFDYHEEYDLKANDPTGFRIHPEDLEFMSRLAAPSNFQNYQQVFEIMFWPIFNKPLANVQSEWNMDKPLEQFADPELNVFSRPVSSVRPVFDMCAECGTIADPDDKFCSECAEPIVREKRVEDDEFTEAEAEAEAESKRQKTAE